uniref:Cytochrome P450 n=1 Tax=Panagrolaimus sp. JU765 TaxID=591449 RepID=A0AC34PUA0_9BILA
MLTLLLVCGIFAASIYGYFWNRSKYFKRRGIPGPEPESLFTGSLKELQQNKTPISKKILEWEQIYGKTFGYFEGGQKVIATSDLSVIRDVFQNKFENFHSRKPIHPFPFNPDTDERANVFTGRGLRWKRFRTLIAPCFSQPRLRNMQITMLDTTRHVMNKLEEKPEEEMNIAEVFLESSTDVIERIAFGKEQSTIGQQNPIMKLISVFFDPAPYYDHPLLRFYAALFEFQDYTYYLHKRLISMLGSPLFVLADILVDVIARKRTLIAEKKNAKASEIDQMNNNADYNGNGAKSNYEDFVDLFLNCEASDEDMKVIKAAQNSFGNLQKVKIEKKLTDQEVISMCSVIMLAGVDTTAMSMTAIAYCLATHPEIQTKLIAEIDSYIHSEEDINMDTVNQIDYLEWCIKEALRCIPIAAPANSRICMNTCTVGENKWVIEKDVSIVSNVWSIHHDKSIWGQDASEFVPERWNPVEERLPADPFAYQPFGLGPRQCLGMKFAFLEMKLMYCHLLKRFRIESTSNTKCDIYGLIITAPRLMEVKLTRRQ